jgi:hypothetical protein
MPYARTRKLRIIAQDPSLKVGGNILDAVVDVPHEEWAPGPRGHRVQVVDFDSSTGTFYLPPPDSRTLGAGSDSGYPFENASDDELLDNPHFHSLNVYAIVMRTLARFERALGRRVSWSFGGSQINVAPHAFAGANAFYSNRDQGLFFGYFPSLDGKKNIFTCLSHDVVVHETTHALVDGLRERYIAPSSPDQAAFHEGFADVVALLSVFSLPEVVEVLLDLGKSGASKGTVAKNSLTAEKLRENALLKMGEQMGDELLGVRGDALRRSADLKPSPDYYLDTDGEFLEPHRRGEIFVAAMMNSFLEVWCRHLQTLGTVSRGELDRGRVVQEGADAADRLLRMSIRALDYAPPTDLLFGDFLSALLTADFEAVPDDSRYNFRQVLRNNFTNYGIRPASSRSVDGESGIWDPPPDLIYDRTHFESMRRDPDEVFRFIWENRKHEGLHLSEEAYSKVLSVRPCYRVGPDGFVLRETVAEYIQIITLLARELPSRKIKIPEGMSEDQEVTLYGGGALIFGEDGRLKFHVHNSLDNQEKQSERLKYLQRFGFFDRRAAGRRRFVSTHLRRAMRLTTMPTEEV